jgi:hypothetical protein
MRSEQLKIQNHQLETELVPFGILEVKADDELAIGESTDTQDPKDESNIASLVDERNAVEHKSDSKGYSRLRASLNDLCKIFTISIIDVDQLAGGGLDPAIVRQHGDDADGTIDYLNDEEMFEMLLAG